MIAAVVRRASRRSSVAALAARVRAIPTWQVTLGVALLVLGFLIAAQLASEGPRIRNTSQERTPWSRRRSTSRSSRTTSRRRSSGCAPRSATSRRAGQGGRRSTSGLNDQLRRRDWPPGSVAMTGPGLVIQLADFGAVPQGGDESDYLVSGQDVRAVVDELWLAGAEGIAVNGERVDRRDGDRGHRRLGPRRTRAYLAPPYQVSAIGAPDMYDRLTASPGFIDFIRAGPRRSASA